MRLPSPRRYRLATGQRSRAAGGARRAHSHLLEGDATAAAGKLKEQPGGDLVCYGGESFTAALLEEGLVDEYRVLVSPVLLGKGGPRLFGPGSRRVDLTLADVTVTGPGVAALTYCPSA